MHEALGFIPALHTPDVMVHTSKTSTRENRGRRIGNSGSSLATQKVVGQSGIDEILSQKEQQSNPKIIEKECLMLLIVSRLMEECWPISCSYEYSFFYVIDIHL